MNRDTLAADPYLYFRLHMGIPWTRYFRFNVMTRDLVMVTVNNVTGKTEVENYDGVGYHYKNHGDTLYKIRHQNSASTSYDFCYDNLMSCLENDFLIHFGVYNGSKNNTIPAYS